MRFACSSLPLQLISNILFAYSSYLEIVESSDFFEAENAWIAELNAH